MFCLFTSYNTNIEYPWIWGVFFGLLPGLPSLTPQTVQLKSGCVWRRTFYKNSSFINLQYTSYFTCFISSKSSLFCQWKASNLYENWLYFFVFWWLVIKSDFTSLSYNNNKSRCSLLKRSRIKKKKLTIACYRCQYFIPNPSRPHYEIRKKMSSPPHVWQSL